ncbi:hypothetical protein PYCCODRAFT_1468584 [Trametes coccinea BRFM310]|uniref:RRM domain-containing protein n=1 Tax=Trametes coccinea (strain BRFM310) TaxID=1353009 RepID=A0A1Y2IJU2_TRAC3|nr:hypothetical protein PYCCODRAFT_1468584 [Trametes coccinea BRFM310]
MITHPHSARLNNYHTHKQRVLGNPSTQPAPAWRPNAKAAPGSSADLGSKILISRLPLDVVENEVEVLFSRTVGPVKDVFMVYNSQGRSKGMAVVTFARSGDASIARAKYNGKIVDGRRPIKIELVVDEDEARPAQAPKSSAPSLLQRISLPPAAQAAAQSHGRKPAPPQAKGGNAAGPSAQAAPNPRKRLRAKKGPRRLNKQQQARQPQKKKTVEELNREIDEWRARADVAQIKTSASASMEVA